MTRLFTYQSDGNIEKHRVIHAEHEQAQALLDSGKAVKLDIPELQRLEQKADELRTTYRANVDRIRKSDNPLLQDEKVQKYELDKLEKEYRAKTAEVEAEWKAYRAQQIEEAKVRAARAVIKVTDNDRAVAEQFKNRAALKLAGASNKGEALTEIRNEINLLTDEQKTALQGHIAGLIGGIDGNESDKLLIIEAVQDIRNSDLLAVKVAEQLPTSVLGKQRIDDIARRVVQDEASSALKGGGIDREFYEEHLKGKGAITR